MSTIEFSHFATQLRENDVREEQEREFVKDLIVVLARGCLASWSGGHRAEGGVLLSHLSGSGQEAHQVVLHAVRLMKKVRV